MGSGRRTDTAVIPTADENNFRVFCLHSIHRISCVVGTSTSTKPVVSNHHLQAAKNNTQIMPSARLHRRRAQPAVIGLLAASAALLTVVPVATVSAFTSQISPTPSASSLLSGRSVHASNNIITQRDISNSRLYSTAETSVNGSLTPAQDDEDDDEEWVYEEYTDLTEADFYNSEWKIGIVWNDNEDVIKETWVRLIVDDNGGGPGSTPTNVAIWGDGGKGKWSVDVPNQFFSISKESFGGWFGKRIFAGNADDYYYLQGTVRGWSPIQSASVLGQWQMKRLGVDREEAGIAPWFQEDDEDEEEAPSGTNMLEGSDESPVQAKEEGVEE